MRYIIHYFLIFLNRLYNYRIWNRGEEPELKYHAMNRQNRLTQNIGPEDRIIPTKNGNFRVRKNGRVILRIDDEYVRVTPC